MFCFEEYKKSSKINFMILSSIHFGVLRHQHKPFTLPSIFNTNNTLMLSLIFIYISEHLIDSKYPESSSNWNNDVSENF